jgi:hypothetical protein
MSAFLLNFQDGSSGLLSTFGGAGRGVELKQIRNFLAGAGELGSRGGPGPRYKAGRNGRYGKRVSRPRTFSMNRRMKMLVMSTPNFSRVAWRSSQYNSGGKYNAVDTSSNH